MEYVYTSLENIFGAVLLKYILKIYYTLFLWPQVTNYYEKPTHLVFFLFLHINIKTLKMRKIVLWRNNCFVFIRD